MLDQYDLTPLHALSRLSHAAAAAEASLLVKLLYAVGPKAGSLFCSAVKA